MEKKAIGSFLLLLISSLFSLLLGEVVVRGYLYLKDSNRSFDLVIGTYQKIPGSKGVRYEFDKEHNLEFKADVRFNNWGYRSDFDLSDEKGSHEFRIAVFGDSYTECETNDFTWVDVLHKNLSKNTELLNKLDRKTITVANFGRSGSGFQRFAMEYLAVRERFKPDLTIFAFIDEDFNRLIHKLRRDGFTPPSSKQNARSDIQAARIENYLQIPNFGGQLYAVPSGSKIFERTLYYTGQDHSQILGKENVNNAKRFLSETVAREKYLKSWGCELCKLVGSTVQSRFPELAQLMVGDNNSDDIFLQAASESIEIVGPEPLILVNLPTFYETINQHSQSGPVRSPQYFPQLALRKPSLPIIPLADFLPKSASYEEKYSWFTLPWDGHPSNKGAQLFGETLTSLLADYLSITSGRGSKNPYMLLTGTRAKELILREEKDKERDANEVKAYKVLAIARKERAEKKYQESIEHFSEVLQLAPHIGMPGLLWVERGEVYQELGRFQEALEDYERAIAINPHQSFIIRHLSIANALGNSKLVISDVNRLETCCKDSTEVKEVLARIKAQR